MIYGLSDSSSTLFSCIASRFKCSFSYSCCWRTICLQWLSFLSFIRCPNSRLHFDACIVRRMLVCECSQPVFRVARYRRTDGRRSQHDRRLCSWFVEWVTAREQTDVIGPRKYQRVVNGVVTSRSINSSDLNPSSDPCGSPPWVQSELNLNSIWMSIKNY